MWLGQTPPSQINWPEVGLIGLIVLGIIVTGLRKQWLFTWVHNDIVAGLERQLALKTTEAEEWKRLALTQAGIITHTVDRTAQIVTRAVVAVDPRISLHEGLPGDEQPAQ